MMGISDKTFDRGTQGEADCQYTNHSGIRWVGVKQAKCEQRYYAWAVNELTVNGDIMRWYFVGVVMMMLLWKSAFR